MGGIFRALLRIPILRPILRPLTRFLVGMIAIPLFRMFLKNVVRLHEMDEELEKDLEQWFRGSLYLLAATANMESVLFDWVPLELGGDQAWIGIGFRLLLAIGVIEAMPDQELFAVIHPGPPKIKLRNLFSEIREKFRPLCWGLFCKHLNRSSPAFAIMAAIFVGPIGWVFYGLALVQYLVIGLVTSRDKAMDVLGRFDRQVAQRRREIIDEFNLTDPKAVKSPSAEQEPASLAAAATDSAAADSPSAERERQKDESKHVSFSADIANESSPGYVSK